MVNVNNNPNRPEKLLEVFPDPTSLVFSKGFTFETSLKAEVLLVKLCPLCSSTLFLTQIICRTCGTYVSKRERPSWYKHAIQKKSKKTLQASDLNKVVTDSEQVFAEVGCSDVFWFEITLLDVFDPGLYISKRLVALFLLIVIALFVAAMFISTCF